MKCTLLLLLATVALGANAQVLDPTFATEGTFLGDTPGNIDEAGGMGLMDDGRIVIAGRYGPNGQSSIMAARYLSDGQPDPTFGNGGMATVSITGNDYAQAMALQPDGKVLVTGITNYTDDSTHLFVVRFDVDGLPDAGFGIGGIVDLHVFERNMNGKDILVMPDGGILIGGGAMTDQGAAVALLVKLLPNGSLDPDFLGGGVSWGNPLGGPSSILAITLDPQGRIVAAGMAADTNPNVNNQWAAWRFTADGVPDESFGTGGFFYFDFTDQGDMFTAVTVQPDGRILLGGTIGSPFFFSTSLVVVRLLDDGTVDLDWNYNTYVYYTGSSPGAPHDLHVQPDGHVLISGEVTPTPGTISGFLARTDENGVPDPNFGTDGVLLVGPESTYTFFWSSLIQPDGKWLVGGMRFVASSIDIFMQRYDPDIPMQVPAAAHQGAGITYRDGRIHVKGGTAAQLQWTLLDASARCLPVGVQLFGDETVLVPRAALITGCYVVFGSNGTENRSSRFVVAE